MKRLFFPWKTKEKKARFARVPHYNIDIRKYDTSKYIGTSLYLLFCLPSDNVQHELQH